MSIARKKQKMVAYSSYSLRMKIFIFFLAIIIQNFVGFCRNSRCGRKVSRGEIWIATHKHVNGEFSNEKAREIVVSSILLMMNQLELF